MANIYFISLGCDKNRIDAEIMLKKLSDAGHDIVADAAEADCAVVNTCGFIESAKQEAIDAVFDMVREKQKGRLRALVVTGCLAERYRAQVADEIPEIDAVVGLAGNADICAVVEAALAGKKEQRFGEKTALPLGGARLLSTPPHYAYIKIAEGCSNHCTYCAIPSIRGPFRSRAQADILDEAASLARDGVRELIVIAQDTTSYGRDLGGGESLAGLLAALSRIDGLWKIRVLYAYPDRIDDALIGAMASLPKVARYLDLPLQHADGGVLRRMGRFGDRAALLALLQKLRARIPGITLRSTFIVGFPGETDAQFEELLGFLRDAQFDRAGCFEYSPEEGTPAERLAPRIGDDVKAARAARFREVQSAIMAAKNRDKIGARAQVICDGFDEQKGMFACRSEGEAPDIDPIVWLPLSCDLMVGDVYDVRITGADDVDVYAEL
ncbi:MAG: 30S ribosomal protein S12 methylthiotransferase RimO [Oscillospiraceae bacterium]|nr:30S ribosomal protein S12 methylthiotransferase RimO [Oscillospiraceae bacterium]